MQLGRMCPTSPPYHLISSELVARRMNPFAAAEAGLSPRELHHLTSRAARLAKLDRCPQVSVVLSPIGAR
jgi:hypothetical protein